MKKNLLFAAMLFFMCCTAFAQRHTDQLDRGLVAMPASTGNFISWRRQADEYYNVTYNLYRGGTKIAEGLRVTNFNDKGGAAGSTYQVEAVVNGVAQAKCAAMGLWNDYPYKNAYQTHNGYLDIALAKVYDRDGNDVTENYSPNDAEMADLDGDGQLDIIIKRLNTYDASTAQTGKIYPEASRQFVVLDAYKVNWQTGEATLLWRIDCGPNMVSLNSTEIDIIAYDWDEDGKAEVVLRGADNMIVYDGDGKKKYDIGDMSVNTRNTFSTTNAESAWTHTGAEYLIYINGENGDLYQKIDYPLTRESAGAWGDNYGHRSSKYFFGAPFLDGRKASLFLGRGIYTRHKMMAMDLNTSTHEWSERWSWNCNDPSSPWYGNGYHNFIVADVDEDGRDEIVYGSMVIDDNGNGLSTTGYGHGDAQHVSDFDPYRKGLEFYGCLEEKPNWGSNYRNATTSEVYYKHTNPDGEGKSGDDGRCLMGNLSNNYPGSIGRSVGSGIISAVKDIQLVDTATANSSAQNALYWSHLNYRIFWDGDLRDEILDSPGNARDAAVYDYESGRLFTSEECNLNNDSKNNPCFQGDIIGDWREEIVVRCGTNIRVFTTGIATEHTMPCLWYDHEYRQAMVWQMMAYNQPPHVSYFVGEMEGITQAPPPLTNSGRTEISNGGNITTTTDHLLLAETNDMSVSVTDGAAPYMLTVNTPSWVQGHDANNNITAAYYTHTLTGGAFTGGMTLTKQGDGLLVLPNVTEAYTGKTDVWAGSLAFSGTFSSSPVWMNRHTKLFGKPTINNSLTMEYGSAFYPSAAGVTDASAASYATANISMLNMHEGSRMVIQIDPANTRSDSVNIGVLTLRTRSGEAWTNFGPQYLKPVIEIDAKSSLGSNTRYTLGKLDALTIDGAPVEESSETAISSVELEGAGTGKLYFYNGKLVLDLNGGDWEPSGNSEIVVVNCDFNNGETLFTSVSRMTVANDNNAKFTTANNSLNVYSLATYDFSDAIGNDATAVKIEFLFWIPNVNAAYRRFFTVGQADKRTGFGNKAFSTAGSMFSFGLARNSSANYFSINGASTTAAGSAGSVLGAWARAEIYVDNSAKTVNYKITNVENTTTYYSANGVAFVDGSASYCNQLDFFDCQNNIISYLDNLVITKYVIKSKATTYTVKYQDGEGNDLKEPAVYKTSFGAPITASASDMATFNSPDGNTKYIYVTGNESSVAHANAEYNVLTLVFSENPKVAYSITAKNGDETLGEVASGEAYTDGSTTVYWNKFKQFDSKWYETSGSYGKTIYVEGNTDLEFTPSDIEYFFEAENLSTSRSGFPSASGFSYSGGSARRNYSEGQMWSGAIAEGGKYILTFPYAMANSSSSTIVVKTRDTNGNYTDTDLSLTTSTAGTFSDEITIPAGSSVAICNEFKYNSNILIDYLTLTKKVVTVAVGSTGYTTFASAEPLDLTKLPDGVTAYYASAVNGNNVVLTAKSDAAVEAGTGLVLKAPEGTYKIPVAVSGSAIDGNLLVGCTTASTAYGAKKYVLWNDGGVAKFRNLTNYTPGSPMTIPAGKAYLDTSALGVKVLNIIFDDETITGVETVQGEGFMVNDEYYNLNGQRVTKDYKGIVIVNGKKYLNK